MPVSGGPSLGVPYADPSTDGAWIEGRRYPNPVDGNSALQVEVPGASLREFGPKAFWLSQPDRRGEAKPRWKIYGRLASV